MELGEEQSGVLKAFLLKYLIPEKCYERFFHHLDFSHVPCVKIAVSKVIGFWIVGTLVAPVFQLWRVCRGGRSEGLSAAAVVLDLVAVSTRVAFCVQHNFPLGAWGDSVFVLVQLALLTLLIQHYKGHTAKGVVILGVYAVFMSVLTSPLTPRTVVTATYEWKVLVTIASRLIQVGCNQSSGCTGQLSGAYVFLVFMGSLGDLLSSIQDSGHSLHSQACVLSSCASAFLLLQILMLGEGERDGAREKKEE
ncbi:mannose-P-dolichol utilization defect 1a [Hoplias malabaricus]|uniref:mannose-P-dolichol utilization defect 1a n=1 Tax=Hoplias malabaricus TaxID=27720 RepID=UPI003462CB83